MSEKYSFVALDLDGTTLDSDHHLSSRSVDILRNLSSLGVTVAIATGRSTRNIGKYLAELNLPQSSIPLVCFNGSFGFIFRDSKFDVAYEDPLPAHLTNKVLLFAEQQGCVAQYYNGSSGDVYAVPTTDEHSSLLKRYEQLVGHPQVLLESYEAVSSFALSAKVLIMTNHPDELIEKAAAVLQNEDVTIIKGSPHPFFVEFLRGDVNKGAGLLKICKSLGVTMEEVVAFGDGDNDKEMLAYAGLGCAVKNARPVAQSTANLVLEWTNDEDAVAKQLENMLERGEFRISNKSS